jgi:PIN domain nuclease of toxin-antitoxin system
MKNIVKQPKYVMDASALLAFANNEPYNCNLKTLFDDSIVTTFNLTEAVRCSHKVN